MEQSGASAPDEAALLAGWVGGQDEASLSALIKLHRSMVTGVCRRILRRAGDAEDAVQETFIALAGKAATIEGSIGGWLRIVATRNAMAQLRALQRQRIQDRQADPVAPVPGEVPTDIVDACLAELTVAERDLIVRLFYLGETQADIARLDRSSRLQIHRRLQQALERLRTLARRRGLRIAPAALLLLLAGGDEATIAEAALRPQMATVSLVGVATAGLLACLWLAAGGAAPAPVAAETLPAASLPPASVPVRPEADITVVGELPWMPGQRIAGAGIGEIPAMTAGMAIEDLEVALDRDDHRTLFKTHLDPEGSRFIPLARSPHLKPVLLRWRDGRQTIGLRCDPPASAALHIRPLDQTYDGFRSTDWLSGEGVPGEGCMLFRRHRSATGKLLTEFITREAGTDSVMRTWTWTPVLPRGLTLTPPAVALRKHMLLSTLRFMRLGADEARAMEARCPDPGPGRWVTADPALLVP